MKYQLAVFDFDGTLANTFPWLVKVLNRLAADYGFKPVDPEDLETMRGFGAKRVLHHLGVARWKVPRIAHHMRALIAQEIHEVPLFGGVEDLLQNLSEAGITLALVSSNDQGNIEKVLGAPSMGLFAHCECGVSVFGKAKKLKKTVRALGMDADRSLYVGDEIRDIEAAKKVGMAAGAVAWGYNRLDALREAEPEEVFQSMTDIAELLVG